MKTFKVEVIIVAITGLFFLHSPSVKVTSDYDHYANFAIYKIFAVYDPHVQHGQVSQLNADLLQLLKSNLPLCNHTIINKNYLL